jgi:hypothetical protein
MIRHTITLLAIAIFAWVSIFEKQAHVEWKIVRNVSTNGPEIKN